MLDPSLGAMPSLAAMQRGMLGRILGSPTSDPMPAIGGHALGPSPGERLGVYVHGYAERLRACLATDFPVLRALVGEQVFDLFVRGYLAQCPSRSPSLYDLGAGFADYLEATRPADGADPLDALPSDLARLERARTEVHRARGTEGAVTPDVAPLILMMPHIPLAAPETLRLVRSDFALEPVLDAVDRGAQPPIPEVQPAFYAVARVNYRVAVHELGPRQFAFLQACSAGGDLASALAAAAAADALAGGGREPDMLAWVPLAIDAGLLTVRTDFGAPD